MSNRATAEKLADRLYTTVTTLDQTTTGEPRYMAYSMEVPYCIGSGATANFARADLLTARADMFEVMLDDGLAVPEPMPFEVGHTFSVDLSKAWWTEPITKVEQPKPRYGIGTVVQIVDRTKLVIGDDEDGQHD